MRGLRPDLIPVLVARDVAVVKKEAAIVVHLNGNGVVINRNPEPRLNVLAVIGPGEAFGKKFEEALLCEVGIGKSRPYHMANKPRQSRTGGESAKVMPRRKWFYLSDKQYQQLAPIVFSVLQETTNQAVRGWKKSFFNNNPWYVPARRSFFLKRWKKVKTSEKAYAILRGTRYAVSLADRHFLSDIFSAELETNQQRLSGLRRYLDKRLSIVARRKRNGRPKAFVDVEAALDKKYLSRYLAIEVLRRFVPWHRFFDELCALVGWNGKDATPEHKLIAAALPRSEQRLNEIQIRVTTGLDQKKDHIVFEVFPNNNGLKPPAGPEILSGDNSLFEH